jgi:hypothetical protein
VEFGIKWSATDYMFCIHQILEKIGECTEHQLFTDFKKAYHSVRRDILYNTYSHSVWYPPGTIKANKNVTK